MDIIHQLLLKEKEILESRLKEVNIALNTYASNSTNDQSIKATPVKENSIEIDIYNLSHSQRLLYTLKENGRFMKIREIAEFLVGKIGGDADELTKQMSKKTRRLKELNKIQKIQIGSARSNTYWGSPSWFNQDGTIKEAYMYDENSLKSNKEETLFDL